jgi:hypothetical protein
MLPSRAAPPWSGSTSRSLMLSRRLADSRARLLPGVAATVDTDFPVPYSSPPPLLLPADAARHDRTVRFFLFLICLHGSAATAPAALDDVGIGPWCPARKEEGLVAAVSLIPSSASSWPWLQQL